MRRFTRFLEKLGISYEEFASLDNVTSNLQSQINSKAYQSDLASLELEVDNKAESLHNHAIEDVTDLSTELLSKADSSHGHAIGDVTDLQTSLDGKSNTDHTHDLSADPKFLFDDFAGGVNTSTGHVGNLGWNYYLTGSSSISGANYETDSFGTVITLASAGICSLYLALATWSTHFFRNLSELEIRARKVHWNATSCEIYIGHYSWNNTADAIYFFASKGHANWKCITKRSHAITTVITNVPIDSNYHLFKIKVLASSVEFYIDNVLVATITTNLPNSNFEGFFSLHTFGDDNSCSLYTDYAYFKMISSR